MERSENWRLTFAPFALFVIFVMSCASPRSPVAPKPTPSEPGGAGLAAYYDLDVQRIFDRSCGPGCHEVNASAGPQIGVRQTGLVLTANRAYDALFSPEGSKNGPVVIRGRPDDSLLFWKIATDPPASDKRFGRRMPASVQGDLVIDGAPLAAAEIALIRAWILDGARRTTVPSLPAMAAATSVDSRTVDVTFSGEIASGAADLARRYEIAGGGGGLAVLSASATGQRTVRLITAAQQPGVAYSVSAFGVPGVTVPFQFVPAVLQVVKAVSADSVTVDVTFSEPVDPATAVQSVRYGVAGLSVQTVSLQAPDVVRLKTSPQGGGVTYTVVVSGVLSLRGGTVQAGQGDRATFSFVPPVSFARDVQPIFTGNCALSGCHGGANATYGLRLDAGFSYRNLVGVISVTRSSVLRVKVGDPDNSMLIQKLEGAPGVGSRMPLGGALGASDIQTIRQWIAAGAKDN